MNWNELVLRKKIEKRVDFDTTRGQKTIQGNGINKIETGARLGKLLIRSL